MSSCHKQESSAFPGHFSKARVYLGQFITCIGPRLNRKTSSSRIMVEFAHKNCTVLLYNTSVCNIHRCTIRSFACLDYYTINSFTKHLSVAFLLMRHRSPSFLWPLSVFFYPLLGSCFYYFNFQLESSIA